MVKLVIDDGESILYELTGGKINKVGANVKHQNSYGLVCFFRSMRTLREPAPLNSSELLALNAKKQFMTFFNEYLVLKINFKDLKEEGEELNDNNSDFFLKQFTASIKNFAPGSIDHLQCSSLIDSIKKYQNRTPKIPMTALEYLKKYKEIELEQKLAHIEKILNIKFPDLYEFIYPFDARIETWGQLKFTVKLKIALGLLQRQFGTLFSLTDTTWHPERNKFADLSNVLRERGPLIVAGRFGTPFYKSTPKEYEQRIGNIEITSLGWPASEYFGDDAKNMHSVIIVGCNVVNGKSFVYFNDPSQESLPNHKRALFIMSYENFVKRIISLPVQGRFYSHEFSYGLQSNELKLGKNVI